MADPLQIGILLYPNVTQLDATGPAQFLSGIPGAKVHMIWKTRDPVPTDAGFSIVPTTTFADCPALDAACLRTAAEALDEVDAVIVPSFDGGYVLLGLRRFDPSLFEGIAWSTSTVAAATRVRLDALAWSYQVLPALQDIDVPADLVHLPSAG